MLRLPIQAHVVFYPVCMQDYPKLSQSYYALLECLAQDHMPFISNLEPHVFLYVMSTISEGLSALGKALWLLARHFVFILVCWGSAAQG